MWHILANACQTETAHAEESARHCAESDQDAAPCVDVLLEGPEWAYLHGCRGNGEMPFNVATPIFEAAEVNNHRQGHPLNRANAPPDLLRLKPLAVQIREMMVLRV